MRIGKLKCTFCGKTEDQVSKLVAGPRVLFSRVHICDGCAALVVNAIEGGNVLEPRQIPRSFLGKLKDRLVRIMQKRLCQEAGVV